MLVLSRQRHEEFVLIIGPGVVIPPEGIEMVVSVVDFRGDKVRLGIEGPREIEVYRAEVWEAIKRKNALPRLAGGAAQ